MTKQEKLRYEYFIETGIVWMDYLKWVENKALTIPVVSNNEVALKAFVEEYVEAFEDGQGSDTALYRQAKSLL